MKQIVNWKKATVFDIESDGMLDQATMFHTLSFQMYDGKKGDIDGRDENRFRKFFQYHRDNNLPLVAHNGILYDIPLCEKLLKEDYSDIMVIDTLAISWYLNTKREMHGLNSFLEDYGIAKPEVGEVEWLKPLQGILYSMRVEGKGKERTKTITYKYICDPEDPSEEYLEKGVDIDSIDLSEAAVLESDEDYRKRVEDHRELMKFRCQEDVKINVALWEDFMIRLNEIYTITKTCVDGGKVDPKRVSPKEVTYLDRYVGTSTVDEYVERCLTFLMFKMDCARLQEKTRWKVDEEYLGETEEELGDKIKMAKAKLEKLMPPVPKYSLKKKPKGDPNKKDGTPKISTLKWNGVVDQYGLKDHYGNEMVIATEDPNVVKVLSKYEDPNANSSDQLKKFFFSHGWVPETFKYVKDNDAMEAWVKGGFRKKDKPVPRMIPQISKDGDEGKELCPSILKLAKTVPDIMAYDSYTTIKHRWDTVKGFQRDLSDDGYLKARIGGTTNTLRVKHREIVNLVGVDKPFGENIRGSLTCRDGEILLGSDLSSLEDRVKHHFMLPHDPDYVATMMADDYDPHILTAHSAGMVSDEELSGFKLGTLTGAIKDAVAKARKGGKTTNYACLPVESSQVLTKKGWKNYEELSIGDTVLTYNTEKGCIEEDSISKIHFYPNQPVVSMGHNYWSIESTVNHRWYGWQRRSKGHTRSNNLERYSGFGFKTTGEVNSEFNILSSAEFSNKSPSKVTKEEASFMGWILSDGYYKWSKDTKKTSSSFGKKQAVLGLISQAEHKFHKEVKDCLDSVGAKYRIDSDNTGVKTSPVLKFCLTSPWLREFLDRVVGCRKNKHDVDWVSWILKLSDEARDSFLYSFWLADGNTKGKVYNKNMIITQNEGNICDAVELAMFFTGKRVTRSNKHESPVCKQLTQISRGHVTAQEFTKKGVGNKDVFCITTKNGTFITRQNDTITITGNSVYGGSPEAISRGGGIDLNLAKQLHAGYWKLNWSVKAIAEEQCVFETASGAKWLVNPVNGIAYSLRTEKDRFSTLCQGTGSFFFDMWVDRILETMQAKWGKKTLTGSFHDEIVLCFKDLPHIRVEMEKIVLDSISWVSKEFLLRRTLSSDVQFDKRYSGIH